MTKLRWSSRDEAWTANVKGRDFAELEIRVLTDDKSTQPTDAQLRAVALVEELAEKGLPSLHELARRYAMQHLPPDIVKDMEDEDLAINIQVAVIPRLRESEIAYVMFLGNSDIDIEHGVAVLCKDGVKFAVTHSDVAYGDHDWDETAEFDQTLGG